MDKISHIVGGSARVGATDNKSAPAVRPGTPSFGRPIGTSPQGERDEMSTAERAGAIQSDMLEQKKTRADDKIAADMTSQFFGKTSAKEIGEGDPHEPILRAVSGQRDAMVNGDEPDLRSTPSRYTPRGSYVDVRA